MSWMWTVIAIWVVLAVAGALVLGRAIHLADRRESGFPGGTTPEAADSSAKRTRGRKRAVRYRFGDICRRCRPRRPVGDSPLPTRRHDELSRAHRADPSSD